MVAQTTILHGMKEIRTFLNRSEATVIDWINRYEDIPIRKIDGRWESDRDALEEWRRRILLGLEPIEKGRSKRASKRPSQKPVNTN